MRYIVTEWEDRLFNAFKDMYVKALRYAPICLECGKYFVLAKGQVPTHCNRCGVTYTQPTQFTIPDFIIIGGQKETVVYVDGKPHEKTRRKKKDLIQRTILKDLGYQVIVIKNNLIDAAELSWLRVIANGIKYMTLNPEFYKRVTAGEKELVGVFA